MSGLEGLRDFDSRLAVLKIEVEKTRAIVEADPVLSEHLRALLGNLEVRVREAIQMSKDGRRRLQGHQETLNKIREERDPVWEAAAAYGMAHARSSANKPRALMTMPQTASGFESLAGQSRMASEVYGMLCLSAALACAVDGDHAGAEDHGAEAARIAERLGDEPDAFELFGVSNVGVWRTSLAVEAGNAERALEYASTVEPRALASNNRRGALAMEIGRALAMQGKDARAVAAFRRAESLSPAQVLNNPLLRELVRNMLDEARRKAGGRELRGLAWRMGLV
jgi:hypothetical protein